MTPAETLRAYAKSRQKELDWAQAGLERSSQHVADETRAIGEMRAEIVALLDAATRLEQEDES